MWSILWDVYIHGYHGEGKMYCDKVFSKPIYTKHTEIERNKEINYCNFKDLKKISSNYLDDQTFWTLLHAMVMTVLEKPKTRQDLSQQSRYKKAKWCSWTDFIIQFSISMRCWPLLMLIV